MKNIRKMFKYIDSYHKNFTLKLIAYSLVLGLLPLINIFAPKLIIDELMGERKISYVLFVGFLVIALDFLRQVLARAQTNYMTQVFESMLDMATFDLSDKSLRLPIEKSDSKEVQDKLDQSHHAVWKIYTIYDVLITVVPSLITALIGLGVLIRLNILILALPLVLFVLNKKIMDLIKANDLVYQRDNISENRAYFYFNDFAQDLRYFKDIEIFEGEKLVLDKSKVYHDKMVRSNSAYYTKNGAYQGLMNVIANGSIVGVLAYLAYRLVRKTISIANFTLYFNALLQIVNSTNLLLKHYAKIISIEAQLGVLFDFLSQEEGLLEKGHIKDIDTSRVRIKFDKVSFKYPKSEAYVLKDCTFEIRDKETVALVGKNGAGKSTIVKLLCKFYEPTEGTIYLNGIDIKDIATKEYYKLLSPTFQDFRLFPFRISENITSKLKEDIKIKEYEDMDEAFGLLNVKSWVDSLVEGKDTFLTYLFSENSVEPSGGIGQKLALARSIYHEGKFIIMDEPTSALDPRSEQEIFEHMLDISRGQTSLFISHRLSSTKYADRIIVCEGGKIKESGSHQDLMENDGLYKEMFTAQAELYS